MSSPPPWRAQDLGDVLLGRNTREAQVPGKGGGQFMAELAASEGNELFAVVHYGETTQPQAICWPMDTAERVTVFFRAGDDTFLPTGIARKREH